MKTIYLILAVLIITGCSAVSGKIAQLTVSARNDVFREVGTDEKPQKGQADILIKTSVKTHAKDYYIFESSKSLHGKPGYPFVLNINGQAVTWKVDGSTEDTPEYDNAGKRTPEGGKGVRYILSQRVRLTPGQHKLAFSLPEESYLIELPVILEDEKTHVVKLTPIYRADSVRKESYLKGVKELRVEVEILK